MKLTRQGVRDLNSLPDNATVMVHWHPNYELGDKRVERCTSDELRSEQEEKEDSILAILPLYLYDHSGLTVSTGAFNCPWDSGQVGWVYITESKRKLMGFGETTTKEQYEEIIRDEVKTYDDYLTGQVFGYEVEGKDGEVIESAWGIVGDSEEALKEGKAAAERCVDPAIARELEEEKRKHNIACIIQNVWTEPMPELIGRANDIGLLIEREFNPNLASKWWVQISDDPSRSYFQFDKELRAFILGYACALNQG